MDKNIGFWKILFNGVAPKKPVEWRKNFKKISILSIELIMQLHTGTHIIYCTIFPFLAHYASTYYTLHNCVYGWCFIPNEKRWRILFAPAVTIIDVVLKTTKQSIGKSVSHLLSQIHKTDSYSFDFVWSFNPRFLLTFFLKRIGTMNI